MKKRPIDHQQIMRDLNPQGWSDDQLRAFPARHSKDAAYRAACEQARQNRFRWVDAELHRLRDTVKRIDATPTSARREMLRESWVVYPNPDPLEPLE